MGPQDHLGALLDGMGCTVCEEHVPGTRIRLLAQREDLLFLQLDCPGCGSRSLGFVADAAATPATPATPAAGPPPVAPEAVRLAGADPVSTDDVLDMHAFLGAWTGDLHDLVRPAGHAHRTARPVLRRSGRFV